MKIKKIIKKYLNMSTWAEVNPYYNGWELISLHATSSKPKGVKQWLNFIWGFDIFIYKIPFMKTLILANIIVWLLF